MYRKIITGNGKTVVQVTFDDGSKKVLTYFGPLDTEKIDKELKKINKSCGAKGNKSPQDTEMIELQGENDGLQEKLEAGKKDLETLQGENDGLQEKLEAGKKDLETLQGENKTFQEDMKTLQGENKTLRKELEELKKSDTSDKSDKSDKKEEKAK